MILVLLALLNDELQHLLGTRGIGALQHAADLVVLRHDMQVEADGHGRSFLIGKGLVQSCKSLLRSASSDFVDAVMALARMSSASTRFLMSAWHNKLASVRFLVSVFWLATQDSKLSSASLI